MKKKGSTTLRKRLEASAGFCQIGCYKLHVLNLQIVQPLSRSPYCGCMDMSYTCRQNQLGTTFLTMTLFWAEIRNQSPTRQRAEAPQPRIIDCYVMKDIFTYKKNKNVSKPTRSRNSRGFCLE